MKQLLMFMLLSIVICSCAGPRGDSAGIINGTRIPYAQYIGLLRAHTGSFQQANLRAPDKKEKDMIFEETWRNIVVNVILNDYYKRYGIVVTEKEVIDSLSMNIPASLINSSLFVKDGVFDTEIYLQSLRFDTPVNMVAIRKPYLEHQIPIRKLKTKLIDNELLSSKKAKEIARIAGSKADFDLLVFDPSSMTPAVSDTEIENYYRTNLTKYQLEPIFGLKYFSIPVPVGEADIANTKAIVDTIFQELLGGKSLDDISKERMGDIPGLSLIDSGFQRVSDVDPQILSYVEPLADNMYSIPNSAKGGIVIYQKIQRTKSMLSYRSLFIPYQLSPASINAQYAQAKGAFNLSQTVGIEQAASEFGLESIAHNKLSVNDKWHTDSSIVERVGALLLTKKRGTFLEPLYSSQTASWVIIQLSENQVNRVWPLSEVREQIVQSISESKKTEYAFQKADEWLNSNPGYTVDPLSNIYTHVRYSDANIDAMWQNKSLKLPYLDAIMRFSNKQKPDIMMIDSYPIVLIPRSVTYNPKYKHDANLIHNLFELTLDPDWFDVWLQDKINKAKVQIYVTK